MAAIVLALYVLGFMLIFLYASVQFLLALNYARSKKQGDEPCPPIADPDTLPVVTVQLPIYNERYVAERIIEAASRINYPAGKLEVQVLDDSTDDTVEIIRDKLQRLDCPHPFVHVQRKDRTGYKAGALAEGMKKARGDFIAIFDADFIPDRDFLYQTIPFFFGNPRLGLVQSRWLHINRDYSTLTRMQAFALDAHLSVEQRGRNARGAFINFNGTAGVWRRTCIEDAGGWEHDTLTEDLDLSYRAQLKGWKLKYLENIGSPAELPAEMQGFKNQQFRWIKGGSQCFMKMSGRLIRARNVPLFQKLYGFSHLFNSAIFPCILLTSLVSVPLLYIKQIHPEWSHLFLFGSVFMTNIFLMGFFYWQANGLSLRSSPGEIVRFFGLFLLFLSLSMGLALHNSIAAMEGYLGKKSGFVRTPKFNISSKKDRWVGKGYGVRTLPAVTPMEGLLCLYFVFGILLGLSLKEYALVPFHMMLALGYGYMCVFSFLHYRDPDPATRLGAEDA